jgi:hypothetical protein
MEERVIMTLLQELVTHFGVKINMEPSLERGGTTPAEIQMPGRLIIVGASHMVRMAKHLPENTVNLAFPGFKAMPQALVLIASRLEDMHPNSDDRLVLDLLSNSSSWEQIWRGCPWPQSRARTAPTTSQDPLLLPWYHPLKRSLLIAVRLGK